MAECLRKTCGGPDFKKAKSSIILAGKNSKKSNYVIFLRKKFNPSGLASNDLTVPYRDEV
jgi:hypothetical protein